MKTGTFVYIVREERGYGPEGHYVSERKIPGKITSIVDDKTAMVAYLGEPNHFTPPNKKYGTYVIQVQIKDLERRTPNTSDPWEL